MDEDRLDGLQGDDKIVAEAKQRFDRCQKWETIARERYVQDIKFANADADNGYQWPNDLQKARIDNDKPTLTINKTAQHNWQIINDAKQNKPSIKIRPTGNGATFESSEVYEGVVRHIEYISNAQVAYDEATITQVEGGIGYWRVVTDYANEDTFDQEIFIRPIQNPLSVYIDPDIKQKDGSDARFAFIFNDEPRDEFENEFPEFEQTGSPMVALDNNDGWIIEKHVRVAEYYRVNEKKDYLIAMKMEDGSLQMVRKSELPKEIVQAVMADETTQKREITSNEIEWYKIAGDKIIDRRVGRNCWAGKYIPIVRLIGKETIIEGELDRKGHTRALKDPQRMYNYNSSASIEYGALQTKAPWIAPAQAVGDFSQMWENANIKNYSVLVWNHVDEDGNPIPKPERIAPPQGAEFYVEERNASAQDMMMVSGQYQDSLGQQSNAVSGKAINQRERQGDKATYHFIDHLGIAIRYTGKILIDLIPKIYDTPRIMKILAEDGTESDVRIDPQAKAAYMQKQAEEKEVVSGIFNPAVGKYDVEADIGPAYATRRQEAFNAFSQIAAQNPELMAVCGDLLFKAADFPGADELAERLKRMVPPQALGNGAPPQVAAAQEQMAKLQKILEQTLEELAAEKLKLKGKDMQKDIDAYEAITKRMEALFKHVIPTPKDSSQMLHDVVMTEHQSNLNVVETAATQDIQEESDNGENS